MQCGIGEETPFGMGFGQAAFDLSSLFRMASAAQEQLRSDSIRLPLSFETQD